MHRRAGQREQQRVHQFDAAAIVLQQRRQAAADAQIDAHLAIVRVGAVHVVALFVGHHLQRQLVVIAQEHGPLAVVGNRRRVLQDVDDGKAVFHAQSP